jgi:hypothetical protein
MPGLDLLKCNHQPRPSQGTFTAFPCGRNARTLTDPTSTAKQTSKVSQRARVIADKDTKGARVRGVVPFRAYADIGQLRVMAGKVFLARSGNIPPSSQSVSAAMPAVSSVFVLLAASFRIKPGSSAKTRAPLCIQRDSAVTWCDGVPTYGWNWDWRTTISWQEFVLTNTK